MKTSFQEYYRALIGPEEAEQFFDSIKTRQTRRSLRVNTLKCDKHTLEDWLGSQGYQLTDNPFSKEGMDLTGRGVEWSLKLPYHAGFTYPQDSASMFSIDVLDPQPGETVLDLTAAPGGKSTHIAQRMQNTGVLVSNDLDTHRLKALHSNLERLGVWNTVVTRMMPHKLAEYYPESFDRVLLDPSCSGEGLLVTPDGKPNFWSEKSLKRYASEQYGLLLSAFRLLKPGGRLVFSTCTLNTIENDGVVNRFLEKNPQARLVPIDLASMPKQIGGLKGIRFWPHHTQTKGFFCMALTKTESLGLEAERETDQHLRILTEKQLQPYRDFVQDYFGCELPNARYTLRDEHLFVVSEGLANFHLLPFYSLSFPLLKIYGSDYRPTHGGASWLGLHAQKHVYELNREELQKVFERQPIPNPTEERGLCIARYKNFPLGVGKLTERGVEIVLPKQF